MAAAPPRVERTRSEASLGSASPHSTRSPRKEATDAAAEIVPFDRPDAAAASWYQRRLPRLAIAPVAGRARQQRLRVGRLSLDVLAASRLPVADLGGTSDPYVVATLTGISLGKVKKEWPEELRSHYTTRHVLRNLNPRWKDECVDFDVWRHGAQLKIEVYDFKDFEQDKLLCTCEVDVDDLAGAGPVEAWFSLKPKGGVRLGLRYDVDPLAEASSILWLDAKIKTPPPKFDVNAVYGHALNAKRRLDPPVNLAKSIQNVLTWKDPSFSAVCLAAVLLITMCVDNYGVLIHLLVGGFFGYTYYLRDQALKREARLRDLFREIDADGSGPAWKSKFYGAFNRRVDLDAIDATPARWRGDAGSSPLDGARTAASSPRRNDLVKSTRHTGRFPHRSGRIDFAELRHALVEMERRKLAPPRCPHHAKQLFDRNAITEGSQKHLSFSGFVEVEKGLGLDKDLLDATDGDAPEKRKSRLKSLKSLGSPLRRRSKKAAKQKTDDAPPPGPRILKGSTLTAVNYAANCVEINQSVGCLLGDEAAVLARSSGEEPASPRHRAGVASMAWRTTRRSTRRKILISTQAANRGKAGKKLGVAQKEAAYMVSQLDKMRDLLCWADPKKTAPLVAMNFIACVAHLLLPPRYVMPFYALGAFSGLTEQFYGCINVGSRFQRAVKRYKALQDKLKIPGGCGLHQLDRSADPALWSSVQQCRKSNQKMMERALRETIGNIFRKVDADGSGTLSKEEVMSFVKSEIACPVKSKEASDRLLQAMASYDNAAAVDLRMFTEIVLNSDVAEALLVAEFASQIKTQGVACVKCSPTSSVFNYPTRVAFRDSAEGSALCYLKKAKVWTRLPVNNISKVDLDFQKPHVVVVHCGKKECSFNLANPFYAGALAHVIEEILRAEERRSSLAEQVSPSGRISGTPSKAVAGAVKETSQGTFAKGVNTKWPETQTVAKGVTSLLPRKSDEIFNFKPPPRRQETVSVPPRG